MSKNNYEKNNCSFANVGGRFHRGTQWRTRLGDGGGKLKSNMEYWLSNTTSIADFEANSSIA